MLSMNEYSGDQWRFLYRARWVSSYDGDTPTMLLDLGMRQSVEIEVRVRNLWCPEVTGIEKVEGLASRDAARRWFRRKAGGRKGAKWPFMVELLKSPSDLETRTFTRYVGDIYHSQDGSLEMLASFSDWMVKYGYGINDAEAEARKNRQDT